MESTFSYIAIIAVIFLVLSVYFFVCMKFKGAMRFIGLSIAAITLVFLSIYKHIMWTAVFGGAFILGLGLILMTNGTPKKEEEEDDKPKDITINLKYSQKNGRNASGTLTLINPTFILTYAGANSGKTASVGKPILSEYMRNQVAIFCYDAKENDFTNTAYKLKDELEYKYPIYNANFADPSRGHRFNPIKAESIEEESYVEEYMTLFFKANSGKTKFTEWDTMALGLLKGVAYVFYKRYPQYFSFPHVANFITNNSNKHITALVNLMPESKSYASGFLDASGSEKTMSSIKSTLTGVIGSFAANKKICYVLSGNDFEFNLVDPENPKSFFVSNNFDLRSQISPLVVLCFIIGMRKIKYGNEIDVCVFMDEGTTFEIPDFETYPSELREYKVNFVLLTQSPSLIEKTYSNQTRSILEANASTTFIGRTQDPIGLKVFTEKFSKTESTRKSITRSSGSGKSSKSITQSPQEKDKYDKEFFQNLQKGEFVGRSTDTRKAGEFHYRFRQYEGGKLDNPPIVRMVTPDIIEEEYATIIHDVTKNIFVDESQNFKE